ncbi:MAG: pyridoxal-dependent decarboxylase, partial [Planctomycetota bacterium]
MPHPNNDQAELQSIKAAYDTEAFRELGHRVIDMLADHLKASNANQHAQALPWHPPEEEVAFWESKLQDGCEPASVFETLLQRSVRISDPKYLGHQICNPLPTSALAGLVNDVLNNGSGVYEMGM